MAKKAVLGQLLKRLPKAVGAPPEPEALPESFVAGLEGLDGLDMSNPQPVDMDTGEILEAKVVDVDAPQPRKRTPASAGTRP